MKERPNFILLLVSIAIPLIVGFTSAYITRDSMNSFDLLEKPEISPPAWLFPIAWTILYVLMGIACYMMLRSRNPLKFYAIILYALQLFFNFFWSIIFFNQRTYWFALCWLLIMWVMILALVTINARVSRTAMVLLIPLLAWTTFAAYLNYSIARLNSI